MQRTPLIIGLLLFALSATQAIGNPYEQPGRLDRVTVYRGQALVTRLVDVPGPPGLRELIVTDLPDQVIPGSIQAESDSGITVRAVRYRIRPLAHDVRDEVRNLDGQIQKLHDETDALGRRRALIAQHVAYLDQIDNFVAPTSTLELTHGVLNAEVLKTLTLFVFSQRDGLSKEELEIDRKTRALTEQINVLQRERDQLTGGPARTAREAVIHANIEGDGGTLRVRYLVNNATWSPSYNVRSEQGGETVRLEYNASIHQRSGEDWNEVAMELSTATPALLSKAPVLTPLTLNLSHQPPPETPADFAQRKRELQGRKQTLEFNRNAPILTQQQAGGQMAQQSEIDLWASVDNGLNEFALNEAAGELQILDLMRTSRPDRNSKSDPTEQGISVSYELAGRTSLPSRSDRQSIQIVALDLPAEKYKVATPVLTNFVYDEAEVANTSDTVLLAGPVAAFASGRFVGHGELPNVAAGEPFTVGLGIDTSLRATREMVDRRERTQGGNRVVTFKYRLTVENFGGSESAVRVLDRLPKSKRSQVQVTMEENGHRLSDDRRYRKDQHGEGILRWDTQVPPRATGPDAFAIDYEFLLEYDKAMHITGLAMAD